MACMTKLSATPRSEAKCTIEAAPGAHVSVIPCA
eukprot:CAMPEP_0181215848 /NCGR_PEP_ID=MMETSP1096-20121128/26244_1 /TAXON_ID=156174 ORGANISM="Chrysochromulina ericina, Strain CCMP281" /NCGR_SAMPLE_ID=MMETSP1096 /ASSEMBLY_ACC=CAM_ASM_000453 /LENGTH=33 /DNA_ID= /DNA_START= /DNA_END= /DNA_ORIENTATION=